MKYLVLSLFFCLLLTPSSTFANDRDSNGFSMKARRFFNLYLSDPSDLRVKGLYQPDNDEKGGPGGYDLTNFNIWSELPIHLDDALFLRLGAEYDYRSYDFKKVTGASTALSSATLHKGVVSAGLGLFLDENLLLTGVIRPGVYSDFEKTPSADDLRWFGEGVLIYQINPGAQLVGGAAFNETFDDAPLYPIAGIRLLSESGAFRVNLTFPTEARLGYNLSKDTQLYGGYWISGDEYRVATENREFDVQVQDRRFGVGLQQWLGSGVNLKGELGVSSESELTFKSVAAGQFAGTIDPAPYVSVGLGLAF